MYEAPYELGTAADGYPLKIRARGRLVLATPMLNRGTAFTPDERRCRACVRLLEVPERRRHARGSAAPALKTASKHSVCCPIPAKNGWKSSS
jgi:hypothetical protein